MYLAPGRHYLLEIQTLVSENKTSNNYAMPHCTPLTANIMIIGIKPYPYYS